MARYTVLVEYDPDGPGFVVSVPALPGCFTQGATIEEALVRAKEAVAGHIATLIATGRLVPDETISPLLGMVDVEVAEALPA